MQHDIFVLASSKYITTLSGEAAVSKFFRLPSEKGSSLKGKNLLPQGANSFLLEKTLFQKKKKKKDFVYSKANRKSQKLSIF